MVLTDEQLKTFEEAAKPLIKWLNENSAHPHVNVIVSNTDAELLEGSARVECLEYLRD